MKKYEALFFVNPDLDETTLTQELESYTKAIEHFDGKIIDKTAPKRTELGYIIKKKKMGIQFLVDFEIDGEKIKELSAVLKHKDNILRFTIVVKSVVAEKNNATEAEVSEEPVSENKVSVSEDK